MELLFVMLGGAILGLAARYILPRRDTYGALLVPAVGASAAGIVWAILTWSGWKFGGGWIWVAGLVAAAIISVLVALIVSRQRTGSDASLYGRLSKA